MNTRKPYLFFILRSSSINTLPEKTKENLVRRCVSIWPEIFFELKNINTLKLTASSLPVQMSAYKAMKDRKLEDMKAEFVAEIGGADTKKVEARTKANATRKKNKINASKINAYCRSTNKTANDTSPPARRALGGVCCALDKGRPQMFRAFY